MTKMMAIFLVLFSSVASAHNTSNWMKYHSIIETAKTQVEFMGFKKKYPEHFYSTDIEQFVSAAVSTETFLYVGASDCGPNDYRLKFLSRSVELCTKIADTVQCSRSEPSYPKSNQDPCKSKEE